jgi:Domain of unknown function (DUF4166)
MTLSTALNMPNRSPLDLSALLGARAWARLPVAVQRRFAPGHLPVTYCGLMDLRCSRLGRLLGWLVTPLRSPLVTANARAVPTTVRVSTAGAGVVWERSFDGGVGHVLSTKELDADGGLQERTQGGLGMTLAVLEDGSSLVFESRRYFFSLGGWRVMVPSLLSPGTCRVEHRDLGQGQFRFTLSMRHPLWGETFHQTGVFADPT